MATKSTKKPAAKQAVKPVPSTSRALTRFDEELAKRAQASAAVEANVGSGIKFFSIRAGELKYDDALIESGQIAVVVLDALIVNAFYKGKFDPKNPESPACFAIGYDEKTVAPVPSDLTNPKDAQAEACDGCPNNEFGSSDTGRGKACKNGRRLAVISAGTYLNGELEPYDLDELRSTEIAGFSVPPTALRGWAKYVKELNGQFKRPPLAFITLITVKPDEDTQVSVAFELLAEVDDEAMLGMLMERADVAKELINGPYPKNEERATRPAAKKAGKRASFRR